MDAARIAETVSLPSSVRLVSGIGGLPRLDVSSETATAQVYLQGAHLTRWQPAHVSTPVLWLSDRSFFERGKPIRGGVPVCFPWFGAHGTEPDAPAHGFARLTPWTLVGASEAGDGTVMLAFTLEDDGTRRAWPHRVRVVHRLSIGARLGMALEVHSRDAIPFTFEEALHTYFAVQDVRAVSIHGLENTEYLDKVAAFAARRQANEPVRLAGETDRVYVDTTATCVIRDPGAHRLVTIRKSGSRSTIVWNPWIDKAHAMPDFDDRGWMQTVCVETGNVGNAAVRLDPARSHTMEAEIAVERMSETG